MRRAFVRNLDTSPLEYRKRFRTAWAEANEHPDTLTTSGARRSAFEWDAQSATQK